MADEPEQTNEQPREESNGIDATRDESQRGRDRDEERERVGRDAFDRVVPCTRRGRRGEQLGDQAGIGTTRCERSSKGCRALVDQGGVEQSASRGSSVERQRIEAPREERWSTGGDRTIER